MPALQQGGQDLALQSLPDGRVDLIWGPDGNPLFDDTQEFRVTGLLFSRLGEWWADPTGLRGSRLHQVKRDQRSLTVSQLEAYAQEALRPAQVPTAFITSVSVRATRLGAGRYLLVVSWVAAKREITRRYELQS